ncbi:hypothetical protein M408DRAFT_305943 [Serendipita vermifera MAFF 305830]|uniref:Uncharacterized protein n=1 Tax=Serendipita vermifera MAFF 305830 TaxID=933852 RepID=A0A0C2W309_SERVB|nr:hypothetical protein M408DRAFT_305943 [Serendipita vermifera MAFF 305830]
MLNDSQLAQAREIVVKQTNEVQVLKNMYKGYDLIAERCQLEIDAMEQAMFVNLSKMAPIRRVPPEILSMGMEVCTTQPQLFLALKRAGSCALDLKIVTGRRDDDYYGKSGFGKNIKKHLCGLLDTLQSKERVPHIRSLVLSTAREFKFPQGSFQKLSFDTLEVTGLDFRYKEIADKISTEAKCLRKLHAPANISKFLQKLGGWNELSDLVLTGDMDWETQGIPITPLCLPINLTSLHIKDNANDFLHLSDSFEPPSLTHIYLNLWKVPFLWLAKIPNLVYLELSGIQERSANPVEEVVLLKLKELRCSSWLTPACSLPSFKAPAIRKLVLKSDGKRVANSLLFKETWPFQRLVSSPEIGEPVYKFEPAVFHLQDTDINSKVLGRVVKDRILLQEFHYTSRRTLEAEFFEALMPRRIAKARGSRSKTSSSKTGGWIVPAPLLRKLVVTLEGQTITEQESIVFLDAAKVFADWRVKAMKPLEQFSVEFGHYDEDGTALNQRCAVSTELPIVVLVASGPAHVHLYQSFFKMSRPRRSVPLKTYKEEISEADSSDLTDDFESDYTSEGLQGALKQKSLDPMAAFPEPLSSSQLVQARKRIVEQTDHVQVLQNLYERETLMAEEHKLEIKKIKQALRMSLSKIAPILRMEICTSRLQLCRALERVGSCALDLKIVGGERDFFFFFLFWKGEYPYENVEKHLCGLLDILQSRKEVPHIRSLALSTVGVFKFPRGSFGKFSFNALEVIEVDYDYTDIADKISIEANCLNVSDNLELLSLTHLTLKSHAAPFWPVKCPNLVYLDLSQSSDQTAVQIEEILLLKLNEFRCSSDRGPARFLQSFKYRLLKEFHYTNYRMLGAALFEVLAPRKDAKRKGNGNKTSSSTKGGWVVPAPLLKRLVMTFAHQKITEPKSILFLDEAKAFAAQRLKARMPLEQLSVHFGQLHERKTWEYLEDGDEGYYTRGVPLAARPTERQMMSAKRSSVRSQLRETSSAFARNIQFQMSRLHRNVPLKIYEEEANEADSDYCADDLESVRILKILQETPIDDVNDEKSFKIGVSLRLMYHNLSQRQILQMGSPDPMTTFQGILSGSQLTRARNLLVEQNREAQVLKKLYEGYTLIAARCKLEIKEVEQAMLMNMSKVALIRRLPPEFPRGSFKKLSFSTLEALDVDYDYPDIADKISMEAKAFQKLRAGVNMPKFLHKLRRWSQLTDLELQGFFSRPQISFTPICIPLNLTSLCIQDNATNLLNLSDNPELLSLTHLRLNSYNPPFWPVKCPNIIYLDLSSPPDLSEFQAEEIVLSKLKEFRLISDWSSPARCLRLFKAPVICKLVLQSGGGKGINSLLFKETWPHQPLALSSKNEESVYRLEPEIFHLQHTDINSKVLGRMLKERILVQEFHYTNRGILGADFFEALMPRKLAKRKGSRNKTSSSQREDWIIPAPLLKRLMVTFALQKITEPKSILFLDEAKAFAAQRLKARKPLELFSVHFRDGSKWDSLGEVDVRLKVAARLNLLLTCVRPFISTTTHFKMTRPRRSMPLKTYEEETSEADSSDLIDVSESDSASDSLQEDPMLQHREYTLLAEESKLEIEEVEEAMLMNMSKIAPIHRIPPEILRREVCTNEQQLCLALKRAGSYALDLKIVAKDRFEQSPASEIHAKTIKAHLCYLLKVLQSQKEIPRLRSLTLDTGSIFTFPQGSFKNFLFREIQAVEIDFGYQEIADKISTEAKNLRKFHAPPKVAKSWQKSMWWKGISDLGLLDTFKSSQEKFPFQN